MPLTEKGREIMSSMKKEYGEKEGQRVFYASTNSGRITGVHDDASADAFRSRMHQALDRFLDLVKAR